MILKSDVQDCIFCKSLSWVLVLCRNLGKRHYVFDSFFLSEYRFQIKLDLLCHLWPATGPLPNRRFLSHQSLEWRQEKTRCPKAGRSVVTQRHGAEGTGERQQPLSSSRKAGDSPHVARQGAPTALRRKWHVRARGVWDTQPC